MSNWDLGSFAEIINKKIDNLAANISGTLLVQVNQVRLDVENFTGQSIGSVEIAPKFQPVILNLSLSRTYFEQNAIGADGDSIKLGDFQTKKGGDSNLVKNGEYFERLGNKGMSSLGRAYKYKQTHS